VPESERYRPIQEFLERQGYRVIGEIGPCDIMVIRVDEPPVVVEGDSSSERSSAQGSSRDL
jgi:hypothetical protein